MVQHTFDGFYTPAPSDVPANRRWPWTLVAIGVAVIAIAGVGLSTDTTGEPATSPAVSASP